MLHLQHLHQLTVKVRFFQSCLDALSFSSHLSIRPLHLVPSFFLFFSSIFHSPHFVSLFRPPHLSFVPSPTILATLSIVPFSFIALLYLSGQVAGSYTGTPSSNVWDNIIYTVPNGKTNVVITNRQYNDVIISKYKYLLMSRIFNTYIHHTYQK